MLTPIPVVGLNGGQAYFALPDLCRLRKSSRQTLKQMSATKFGLSLETPRLHDEETTPVARLG